MGSKTGGKEQQQQQQKLLKIKRIPNHHYIICTIYKIQVDAIDVR